MNNILFFKEYLSKTNILIIIEKYWLPLGFLLFLTGMNIFTSKSSYHTQLYISITLPSLLSIFLNPKDFLSIFKSRLFILTILFLAYASISAFWGESAHEWYRYAKRPILIFLFIYAISRIALNNKKLLITTMLVATSIMAAITIEAIFFYYRDGINPELRITGQGVLNNPLLASHIYGCFTSFAIVSLFNREISKKQSIFLVLLLIPLLYFVILTGSRTPLVALFAVAVSLIVLLKDKKAFIVISIFIVLVLLSIIVNIDFLLSRGLSYRPEIWAQGLKIIQKKPVFGHGIGSTININIDSINTIFSDTHNIHLGVAYYLGIVGFFLWILMIFNMIIYCYKNRDQFLLNIGLILLVYGMIAGMFEGGGCVVARPKEVWFLVWLPISFILSSEYCKNLSLNSNSKVITGV